MYGRRLDTLDSYEVISLPIVGATRLSYASRLRTALEPYHVTTVPRGVSSGLPEALERARLDAAFGCALPALSLAS